MTGFDYAIIAILSASVLLGAWRGMVSEVMSLGAWIIAFLVAREWGEMVGTKLLAPYLTVPFWQIAGGWILLFVASILAVSIFKTLARKTLHAIGLGFFDRTLGMVFGAARGVLLILLLVAIGGMTKLPEDPWWRQARLAPLAEQGVAAIKPWLPDDLAKHIAYADVLSQMAPQIAPQLVPKLAPTLVPQNSISK
jgi:membrane protein required for colicin V production